MLYPLPHDVVLDAYRDYVYGYRRKLEAAVAAAETSDDYSGLPALYIAKRITAGYESEVSEVRADESNQGGWLSL